MIEKSSKFIRFCKIFLITLIGMWIPCTSKASAMRQATIAVDLWYILLNMWTIRMANLLLGFIHAFIAGEAVLNKFQSSLVKSIFLVIGVLGGAAKLNHTVFNSITHDTVLPFDTLVTRLAQVALEFIGAEFGGLLIIVSFSVVAVVGALPRELIGIT